MFKKLLCIIFAVIICLACVAPAFADNGGYFTPFTVTVEAAPGTVLYDRVWNSDMTRSIMRPMSIFVPNGTSLTVTGEREFEGEIYLAVTYRDFDAYIQHSKVSLMRDFVGEDLAFPTEAEQKIAVINKNGVVLRKGPSLAYGNVFEKNIPYGTVLKYSKTNSQTEADAQWAFIEYKGKSGWVYIFQNGVENIYDTARVLDSSDIYTGTVQTLTDGAFLTETPNADSAKLIENIPANTSMSFKYYYENLDYSISVFVEYNGIKGWLHTMNDTCKVAVGEKGGLYVLAENGLKMYQNPIDASAQSVATLPKNTNLCVDKQFWSSELTESGITIDRWMFVNYNDTKGWVYCGNESDYCYMNSAYDLKINAANGTVLYAEQNESSESLGIIPTGTEVTCVYESKALKGTETAYWSFVNYNGTNGWIFATNDEAALVENSQKVIDAPFGATEIIRTVSEDAPELKDGLPAKLIITIVCSAAVAIATVTVIAVIIKKKNKK